MLGMCDDAPTMGASGTPTSSTVVLDTGLPVSSCCHLCSSRQAWISGRLPVSPCRNRAEPPELNRFVSSALLTRAVVTGYRAHT